MSHNRQQSYHPRADSPPLIGRIPTPPHRTRVRTSWYRADSPPLIGRVPTPPHTTQSLTPPRHTETRLRTQQPQATVGSRFYNLFHPRARRVEVVETPVRRRHSHRVQTAPTPPPATRRSHTLRRTTQAPTSIHPTATPISPLRRTANHGMSPVFPEDYVPMPEPQPPLQPRQANPTPPHSTERNPAGSPHHREGRYAGPWAQQEFVGEEEQPQLVTETRPVRARPGNREAVLADENKAYRDEFKRVSRELKQKEADIANLRAREANLQQQLADAQERARRNQRNSDAQVDDLRLQLERCEVDCGEKQRQLDQERRNGERRDLELDYFRRQQARPTIIHQDDEERRPRRPTNTNTNESAGLQAIREAQANYNRGRGRGYGGYQG